MNETIINGIDVSKYFIYVVDEGGSTINYKILPNIERLLVERIFEQNQQLKHLQEENEKLKANKRKCAFKSLDNTFCDEAKIKIDKLELDKDCLNASLETARKYRGIAEIDRDKYKQALENIKLYINQECKNKQCPQTCANCFMGNVLIKVNEALDDRD